MRRGPHPPERTAKGKIAFEIGNSFAKGLEMASGQATAPGAYEKVDAREDGWTKAVLHPGGS